MSLLQMLALSLLINGVFFIIAAILRTDVFTDVTYSLTFAVLTALLFAFAPARGVVQLLTAGAVLVWALRLGGYLFYRILKIRVDHRFDDKRNSFVKFGSFWLLQAISVWVILLPVYGLLSAGTNIRISPALLVPGAVIFWRASRWSQSPTRKSSRSSRSRNRKGNSCRAECGAIRGIPIISAR